MSFTPLMMKLTACLVDELGTGPTVMELGNQTFDPTLRSHQLDPRNDILPLVIRYPSDKGIPFDRERIEYLRQLSPEDAKPHTETYYKALGFSEYAAIDVNSTYGSLIMDLNADLRDTYGYIKTFDLVTNNGTGEHIFNQFAVFKNMHQLAKVNGILLFVLPFYNWLNHGFFNFNPLLFTDLAAANDYEVVRLSIAGAVGHEIEAKVDGHNSREISFDWEPDDPQLSLDEFQSRGAIWPWTPRSVVKRGLKTLMTGKNPIAQMSRLPAALVSLADRTPNINVVAALRKTNDDEFKVPLQGMYAGANVEDDKLSAAYAG